MIMSHQLKLFNWRQNDKEWLPIQGVQTCLVFSSGARFVQVYDDHSNNDKDTDREDNTIHLSPTRTPSPCPTPIVL